MKYNCMVLPVAVVGLTVAAVYYLCWRRDVQSTQMVDQDVVEHALDPPLQSRPERFVANRSTRETTDLNRNLENGSQMKIEESLESKLMMLESRIEFLLGDGLTPAEIEVLSLEVFLLLEQFSDFVEGKISVIESNVDYTVYEYGASGEDLVGFQSKLQKIADQFSDDVHREIMQGSLKYNFVGIQAMYSVMPQIFIVSVKEGGKFEIYHEYTNSDSGAKFNRVYLYDEFNPNLLGKISAGLN